MSDLIISRPIENTRNQVLKNTFRLLGLSMVPTVLGAMAGTMMSWGFMAASPILSFIAILAIMFGFCYGIDKNKNNAMGVVLMLCLTGFFGLITGPALQAALSLKNGVEIIAMAAGGTGVAFLVLSAIASNTKRDFSNLGGFLFTGLIVIILASVANMFFHSSLATLVISSFGVLLFSGFILYDVNRVVQGGETNYVMAALSIYLDIYNMFLHLLQLLMALTGND